MPEKSGKKIRAGEGRLRRTSNYGAHSNQESSTNKVGVVSSEEVNKTLMVRFETHRHVGGNRIGHDQKVSI